MQENLMEITKLKKKPKPKKEKKIEIIMINGLKVILDFRCYPFI